MVFSSSIQCHTITNNSNPKSLHFLFAALFSLLWSRIATKETRSLLFLKLSERKTKKSIIPHPQYVRKKGKINRSIPEFISKESEI